MSYCSYCKSQPEGSIHRWYHDEVYGRMSNNDNELFGRLIMEISQAGLSWDIVLNKYEGIKAPTQISTSRKSRNILRKISLR